MSRFVEYEGDGEFNPWGGWRGRAMSGRQTNASLKEFLVHLDAMPVKRIGLNALKDPETGDLCTVGEFAKMRGVPVQDIEKASSAKTPYSECEYEGTEDLEGPTITIGRKAGLPLTIAWELAHFNDVLDEDWVDVDGPPTRRESGYMYFQLRVRVTITPEERWSRVRARVVDLIAESNKSLERASRRGQAKREALTKTAS